MFSAALLRLMDRGWRALAQFLLRFDDPLAQTQRALQALGQSAGQVALGEDTGRTLQQIAAQALAGSGASGTAICGPKGTAAQAGQPVAAPLEGAPAAPRLQPWEGGTLVSLPVRLAGEAEPWGALHAAFAQGLPSAEALTLLGGLAAQAGTALRAAQLAQQAAEKASARAEEEERARLARELHDSVAQALYGINLGAKTARAALDGTPDIERAKASLDYTMTLAGGSVDR